MKVIMGFDEVVSQLWRQRKILELLLFKLEEEHLILSSGRHVWLDRALAEVQDAAGQLHQVEMARTLAVSHLAERLGLGPQPTLTQLVHASPEPWDDILDQHHQALLDTFAQIEQISIRNRELLARGMAATSGALALLGEQPDLSYGADGAPSSGYSSARLVNSTL